MKKESLLRKKRYGSKASVDASSMETRYGIEASVDVSGMKKGYDIEFIDASSVVTEMKHFEFVRFLVVGGRTYRWYKRKADERGRVRQGMLSTVELREMNRIEALAVPKHITVTKDLLTPYQVEELERFLSERGIEALWISHRQRLVEEKLREALTYLNSEQCSCRIQQGYDYAWVKRAIDKKLFQGCERISNYSYPKFVQYIQSLGFGNIAGAKTLAKYYNTVSGREFPWEYSDCRDKSFEQQRRNHIVMKLIEIMTELTPWR